MFHALVRCSLVTGVAAIVILCPRSISAQTNVGQYEKLELTFPFSGNYSNVYDPAVVDVEAVFTAPSGNQQTVPGFYFQNYVRSGSVQHEALAPTGSPAWKVRYAPSEIGAYSYAVTITDSQGTRSLGSGSFNAVVSSNPGFVRAAGPNFTFDNGQQFIPIGLNAPWFQSAHQGTGGWGDGTYGADALYATYHQYGLNYFRLWTCDWNDGQPSPWAKPNISCNPAGDIPPNTMRQLDSWDMDYIVEQAHLNGIYVNPILKHKDQTVYEYLDQLTARYAEARWGYSTSIAAWDLCKEGCQNASSTTQPFASYLSSIDPYHHLISTSVWNQYAEVVSPSKYKALFTDPNMGIVQEHDYGTDCPDDVDSDTSLYLFNHTQVLMSDPRLVDATYGPFPWGKPFFFGETGVNPGGGNPCGRASNGQTQYYAGDQGKLILKGEIWGALMSTSGAYAPWYWQSDPAGAWTHLEVFPGLSAYAGALPPIPASANLFTSYQDTSQVTTSDARLRVIGRKNQSFAMLYVQNTTGTWGAILRDGITPVPLNGNIVLLGMSPSTHFMVRWFDTDAGTLLHTGTPTSGSRGHLTISLPIHITQSIAAIVTAN